MSNVSVFTRRDPFAEFDSLVRSAFSPNGTSRLDFTPAVETVRDGDDVVVRLELPGIDVSNDVSVEVTNGRLVVKGERRDERREESGENPTRRISEIRYGSFERSFGLVMLAVLLPTLRTPRPTGAAAWSPPWHSAPARWPWGPASPRRPRARCIRQPFSTCSRSSRKTPSTPTVSTAWTAGYYARRAASASSESEAG